MADSTQDRTEDPTPRTLEKLRGQGNVPKSQDLSTAVQLLAGALILSMSGAAIFEGLQDYADDSIRRLSSPSLDFGGAIQLMRDLVPRVLSLSGPLVAVVVTVSVGYAVIQNKGFVFYPGALAPKLSNMSPAKGLKKIFSLKGVVRMFAALMRLTVILGGVAGLLWWNRDEINELAVVTLNLVATQTGSILIEIFLNVAVMLLLIGILDFLYQKWQWLQNQKMTKQQVKDERKASEGDPKIKGQIRGRARELLQRTLSEEVKEAAVVVTNPTHYAVALAYSEEKEAVPRVVAKGVDHVAQEIKRLARGFDVPVVEQPLLARALYRDVPLGRIIPEKLYRAVANVLAFVHRLREERSRRTVNG